MRFVATLLVAVTFAGGPVARGVCAAWCHAMLPATVHNCHEGMGEPATATVGVASVPCSPLLGEALAVRDDAAPIVPMWTVAGRLHTAEFTLEQAGLPHGLLPVERMGASSSAPLVLRI